VYGQLMTKGFDPFLPRMNVWTRRGGTRHVTSRPMFPGYLFLNHAVDKDSYLAVVGIRGLVRILGERWDNLAVVPDGEIEAIRRVARADLPATPHPFLREGQRVRITGGVLANVEGIFLRSKPDKGLLVVSIGLLQRSVAVEVDCTLVAPT
jgi:transcription termination/antitermination protein NusG